METQSQTQTQPAKKPISTYFVLGHLSVAILLTHLVQRADAEWMWWAWGGLLAVLCVIYAGAGLMERARADAPS